MDLKINEVTFFVALIFIVVARNQVNNLEPQYCDLPRPVLIPINHPDYMYWPYFVQLHRCGGSCSMISPRVQSCRASGLDLISRSVFNLASNKQEVIQLTNHTSCNCSCVLDPGSCSDLEKWNPDSCGCVCKNPKGQPVTCPANFTWSQYLCKCVCDLPPEDCPVNMEWNQEQCRCACSVSALKSCADQNQLLDKEKCTCYKLPPEIAKRDTTGVPRAVMFGLMIAELLLLLILFDIFLYCKFQTGLVTGIRRKCCTKKGQGVEVPLQKGIDEKQNHKPVPNDEPPAC